MVRSSAATMAVALPLLVGDKARWGSQYIRLGGGVDVVEVEVAVRTVEPPRRHVVGARGLMRSLERPDGGES
jgi:hypothetical protein